MRTNIEWIEQETTVAPLDSAGGVKKDAADSLGQPARSQHYLANYKFQ